MQRLVRLPPAPESARQARRFVTDVLTSAGATEFLDVATLLTSELVTNGIVHAHTELQLTVEVTESWVRIEVGDANPMLPSRRDYTDDALTGRGLEMVELLADDFGMQPFDDAGKSVWFRLGAAPVAPAADDTAAPRPVADAVAVQLVNLPLTLYGAWQQHADAILREATLVALDRAGGRLPEEFALASQALSALAAAVADALADAADQSGHVDLALTLPRSAVPNFPVLRDVLRRCNEMSVAGDLLVPPSLPEIQALRRWVCDEIGRQGQDVPPRAWVDPTVVEEPAEALAAGIVDDVRRSTQALVAADRFNRIVAVSGPAAELLGWADAELEGRRLVTIIPPAYRDLHVAGFTRQMLGGGSRILGSDVDVPALRRDGSEIPVTLRIESRTDADGTRLFVGSLTAAPVA